MSRAEKKQAQYIVHPIPPLVDEHSRILILGSFPSVKSREQALFYGHPQNRFWRVLPAHYGAEPLKTIPEKRAFCARHGIALWDVIASCEIVGSSDSSIQNAVANDLTVILSAAPIECICTNGKTAGKLYDRYILPQIGKPAVCLPSTSPANAAWTLEKLVAAWQIIRNF